MSYDRRAAKNMHPLDWFRTNLVNYKRSLAGYRKQEADLKARGDSLEKEIKELEDRLAKAEKSGKTEMLLK